MKKILFALTILVICGVFPADAQKRESIIKYISENKLYRNGNDVTVTSIDMEWPMELEGDGMPELQKVLCQKLLDTDADNLQSGWNSMHKKLGTEIKHMPDSVTTHYLYLDLQELWVVKDRYVSLFLRRRQTEQDGTESSGTKEFITYDMLSGKMLTNEDVFSKYTDEYTREAFETALANYSQCPEEDKQGIDLTILPKDFAVLGGTMIINLGGPTANNDISAVSINLLYQLGLFKRSFAKWITGKGKKKEQSSVAPIDFDSSLSSDSVYTFSGSQPTFPGGNDSLANFLNHNVSYPEIDMEMHNQGRVVTSFIVEKDGSISDITVISPISPTLDREAVRLVRLMPKWAPVQSNGKPVRTKMILPISFKLKAKN